MYAAVAISPAQNNEKVGCFVSTGDNDNLFYAPPIDSIASVDAYFDILDNVYGVSKVYWRAMQNDQVILYSRNNPDNFYSSHYKEWAEYLNHKIGTGYHGVEAAHKRGMKIWGVAALLDHGVQAQIGAAKGWGPGYWEYNLRIEHPEWIPIDRYGIRQMAGPLCFAYPDARKAMIDMYEDLALKANYDGILFHLYVENFQARNADEFCYNDVLVEAYKKRYGVDIKKEPIDVYAMATLRGEYLTQFFRELRKRLNQHDIQIGICLSAYWPKYPQPWLYDPEMMVGGRILLDWRKYIAEELVDELHVYASGDPYELVNDLLRETQGTSTVVSMMSSASHPEAYSHFADRDVVRVIYGGYHSITEGYLEPQPLSALQGDDFLAKLNVVTRIGKGELKTDTDVDKLLLALNDEHHFVRRQALWAAGKMGLSDSRIIAAAEKLLNDPENAVRSYAVDTLTKIGDLNSVTLIYDCIAEHHNFMINLAASWGLGTLSEERSEELIPGLKHKSAPVRRVTLEGCCRGKYRYSLLDTIAFLAEDPDDEVRWLVARALGRHRVEKSIKALLKLVDDKHPTVASAAAKSLSDYSRSNTRWIGPFQHKMLKLFSRKFSVYDSGYAERDDQWGWRCFGNALKSCGPRGTETLQALLAQNEDTLLSDHAWKTLYVVEDGYHFFPKSMEQIKKEYQFHPNVRTTLTDKPKKIFEPKMMPYIVQNFESDKFVSATESDVGDLLSHTGMWRGLGNSRPAPMIVNSALYDKNGKSLCLTAGDEIKSIDAVRTDYRITEGEVSLEFLLYQEPGSQLTVWLTDSGKWSSNLQLTLGPDGQISYYNAQGKKKTLDDKIKTDKWQRLKVIADIKSLTFKILAGDDIVTEDIALKSDERYNALVLLPAGKTGSISLMDDIEILSTNPAWKADLQGDVSLNLYRERQEDEDKTTGSQEPVKTKIDKEAANIVSPERSN